MSLSNYLKVVFMIITVIILLPYSTTLAHCDGLDGPVVKAAKMSLETGDINHVLIWIPEEDEVEVKKLFNHTLAVRNLSEDAKELADNYFFETVVRVHRAGEGEPYTGLKPAGRDLGHIIPAADNAIINSSIDKLKNHLVNMMLENLQSRFQNVIEKKDFNTDKVEAGRKYVKAYVEFLHYTEKLFSYLNDEETLHKH